MDILILNASIIVVGLILGSFINVLSHRIPREMPVFFSRSQCPHCNTIIPLYRNIPIITYILQMGHCHNCKKSISVQYPIIESLMGLILYLGFNNNWLIDEYILFIWASCLLVTITIIDSKTLTIPLILIALLFSGEIIFMIFNLDKIYEMLLGLLFGLGYLGFTFLITSIIYKKETLGYGDLLLISLIGLWIGPINILVCIFLSSIIGIIIWVQRYYQKVDNQKLPFGSYLSLNGIFLKILDIDFISYMNLL